MDGRTGLKSCSFNLPSYSMSTENTNTEVSKALSIEELRKFDGFDDITDEQASEIIETLKQLALVIIKTFKNQ